MKGFGKRKLVQGSDTEVARFGRNATRHFPAPLLSPCGRIMLSHATALVVVDSICTEMPPWAVTGDCLLARCGFSRHHQSDGPAVQEQKDA